MSQVHKKGSTGGRPAGPMCSFQPDAANGKSRCKRTAKVKIILTTGKDKRGNDIVLEINRCWQHYMVIENLARQQPGLYKILSVEEL